MIFICVCSVAVFVVIILFVLNSLYKHSNAYLNQFVDIEKFQHLEEMDDHSIDIIVLGSNAPKFAFDFSEVKNHVCENLAIGPETFEYDYIILKKYSDKLEPGATILWAVSPGQFFLKKFLGRSTFVKYYKLLKKEEFPEYKISQLITEYKYPICFHPKRIKYLFRDVKPDKRMELMSNPMSLEEVRKDAFWWIHGCWNQEFNINIEDMAPLSKTNQDAVEYNIDILKKAVGFCKSKGFRLIFAYLPITQELSKYFSSDYVEEQMTRYVKEVVDGDMCTLVDYMRDSRFQDAKYYINSFFMNRTGAKIFTKTFVEENL